MSPATPLIEQDWRDVSGWRLLGVLIGTMVLFVGGAVLSVVIAEVAQLSESQVETFDTVFLPILALTSVFAPLWLLVLRPADGRLLVFGRPTARWLLLAVIVGVTVAIGGNLLTEAISRLAGVERRAQVEFTSTAGATVVLWVRSGLVVPVVEEVLFRGVVFNWLRAHGSVRVAVLVSALLFSAVHLNPVSSVSLFLMGVVLAWLYYYTESLLVPIVAHAAGNSVIILVNYLLAS
jgi:membrane protease YdiL (CAAX protease family)